MLNHLVIALAQAAQNAGGQVSGNLQFQVTLGDVISTVGPITAVIGAYIKMRDRITALEERVTPMWKRFLHRRDGDDDER